MVPALAFFYVALASLHAVELVETPTVSQEGTSVTIRWKTDVVCGTRARLGTDPTQLTSKAEGPVGLQHEVTFRELNPATTYHYEIGTARFVLQKGSFTSGRPDLARPPPSRPVARPPASASASTPPAQAAPATPQVPPTRKTWGSMRTLQDHYDRHGRDFSATSPDDYARQAWLFLQRAASEGLPAKLDDTDGTIRVWDPKTRAFAAYNRDGTTKTFFRPESPTYFQRQPGKKIRLKDIIPPSR